MKKILILPVVLLLFASCRHNRLKTNEDGLAEKIIKQEKANENPTGINNASKRSGVLKLREDRSVDKDKAPQKIDLAGNLDNIKEIRLSDVASDIRYIRMEPVPDTGIPRNLKLKYMLMDKYIVGLNLYGIHLYTREGRYIRTIVKNEIEGYRVDSDRIVFWMDYSWKGGRYSVQAKGDDLYYNYINNATGQRYIMKYHCSASVSPQVYKFDPENRDQISGLGEVAVDLNHGNTVPPGPRSHQGMFSASQESFFMDMGSFMIGNDAYVDFNSRGGRMMTILSSEGDTMTVFSRLERLVNYTKSLMRGTDGGANYEYRGSLLFRPPFNDTVFVVKPPNRLVPLYVLNLGKFKVSRQEGVDPGFDLTGKIIPGEWAETPRFIFMTFTKDDYDCPNNRKKKSVKIYHALFSKKDHSFSVISGDPFDYDPEILQNNIDGGVPVWPLSYMTGNDGEMLIPLKGEELKKRIRTEEFKNSTAPADKKKELEILASTVNSDDDILMIIR